MPKASAFVLAWSDDRRSYDLYDQRGGQRLLSCDGGPAWAAWLERNRAFAFQGRGRRINLLKEARAGAEAGYWYAYRRSGARTVKRYLGRSEALTPDRLEAAADALALPSALEAAPTPNASFVPQTPAPLLAPKLQIPRAPAGLVPRPQLLARLDAALERRLTVVAAPAGFGKTALLTAWLRGAGPAAPRAAWVSLDAADNDPLRFWRYSITACQVFGEHTGQAALGLLAAALQPPVAPLSQEMLLTVWLNDLARAAPQGLLVWEDFHTITDGQIHAAAAFFLDHMPPTLHLLVLTRSEPPLPLARLRARGELCELHGTDLRFSPEETRAFLAEAAPAGLPPDAPAQIDRRLAGWPAGLRLLALALRGCDTPEAGARALASFAGGHRTVQDYLIAEVLDAQPAAVQAFLLRTAPLERLTGPLCDAVLEVPAGRGAHTLEALARADLFLEPLDEGGQWHRYHALFAEALRHEARRRLGEEELRRITARAGLWYEAQGLRAAAIEAALGAGEHERAARLLGLIVAEGQFAFGVELLDGGPPGESHDAATLGRWLALLPGPVLARHPALCLSYAIVLLFLGMTGQPPRPSPEQLGRLLQQAEAGFRAADNGPRLGEVYAFRAMVAKQRGAIAESVAWARQSLGLLPAETMSWRGASLSAIGTGEQFAGRPLLAQRLFLEARAISEAVGNRLFTRATGGMICGVLVEQGRLHEAAAQGQRLLAEARACGDRDDIGHALAGLMQISYEWNTLDAAEQEAQAAHEAGTQLGDEEFQAQAALLLAQLDQARGQTAAALRRTAGLLAWLQPHPSLRLQWHARAARALQARLHLAAGDLDAAQLWADRRRYDGAPVGAFQRAQEELLAARLLLAQGEQDAAQAALERELASARQAGYARCLAEAELLLALLCTARRNAPAAQGHLGRALAHAAGAGYVRLFLDAGPALPPLLRAARPGDDAALTSFRARLVRACTAEATPAGPAATLAEPLSPQERRVLRLLAGGRSNADIAAQLVVSLNTVKAHLKHIYRKLDVRSRTGASATARRLGLLDEA